MIGKALAYAVIAHGDQVRKYTGEPYISHPMSVAGIIAGIGGSEIMIVSAILHDVVEDTDKTLTDIQREFGDHVANIVFWLTDASTPEMGNRAKRKQIDREHNALAPPEAQTIKVADLIDNTKSIVGWDKHFARVYMVEKQKLMEVLINANPKLIDIANKLISDYYLERLEQ